MRVPEPSFAQVLRLTDAGGLYEHALGTEPRPEHGYCVDDVARGLVVAVREPMPAPEVLALREHYLGFVLAAVAEDGQVRNRRDADLHWTDEPTVEDCWGRALWALGATVSSAHTPELRSRALAGFDSAARQRSPHRRATAFAAIGAADVLSVQPDHLLARALLSEAAEQLDGPGVGGWAWPEPRLTYGNAVIPEVLLAAGAVLGDERLRERGLALLAWLLREQTVDGHLSVVPVGGRGPGDPSPGFDQQPIEVAALADACARAWSVTHDLVWIDAVGLAVTWFLGDNDSGTPLLDPASGGGCDGLERDGRNENQGAESTLALVSTLQHARLQALTLR